MYGGAGMAGQRMELQKGCDVLVATPGRLKDFIQRGEITLSRVQYLILDEADRMLDMGFEPDIRNIVQQQGIYTPHWIFDLWVVYWHDLSAKKQKKKDLNPNRQTLMYSATFPREIQHLARDFLKPNYLFLKVGRVGGTTTDITQRVMWVEEQDKRDKLREILMSQPPCRTLIFVETKRAADT